MVSKRKNAILKFENRPPRAGLSKIFSNRYEVSYVLRKEAEKILVPKILELFPQCRTKKEIVVTTYFEPVLIFEPKQFCVIRFRQRVDSDFNISGFVPPDIWSFNGPGNLEVKFRKRNRRNVTKMGTFLPQKRGKDIYTLLRLAKKIPCSSPGLKQFISRSNKEQMESMENGNGDNLHLITPEVLLKIAKYLNPQATRVNLRKTFEWSQFQKARITLETKPTFYAYPIEHLSHETSKHCPRYRGLLAEHSDRLKIEIKTSTRSLALEVEKNLQPFFKDLRVHKDKYSKTPYDKMVLGASKQKGALIKEKPQHEIEAKANIIRRTDTASLMRKVRTELLTKKNAPCRLFITSPNIKVRGKAELNRTIIGWQDAKAKWHEVVTIIRLTKEGKKEFGYSAILKWKSDSQNDSKRVLVRKERKEFLRKNMSNKQLLKKSSQITKRGLQIVGVIKKIKYRIIVQDCDGRNFVISLDECTLKNSEKILQQLEVEYAHTVLVGDKNRPATSLRKSCIKCLDYFVQLLKQNKVQVKKTDFRKIDFAGSIKKHTN